MDEQDEAEGEGLGLKRKLAKGEYGNPMQACRGCGELKHIAALACRHCGHTRADNKRSKEVEKATSLEEKYRSITPSRTPKAEFGFLCDKLLEAKMKHHKRAEFVLLGLNTDNTGTPKKNPLVYATGPPGEQFLRNGTIVNLWTSTAAGHFLQQKKLAEQAATAGGSGPSARGAHQEQASANGCRVSAAVVSWLKEQGMEEYLAIFDEYKWRDLADLKEMTIESLEEMKIKGRDKQRLWNALTKLSSS